ncbi:MAG: hypothetical protein GY713_06380, partial [Actinomycetia bacterium]|nr:hypothetical protein [Actinomycetes bacterium]
MAAPSFQSADSKTAITDEGQGDIEAIEVNAQPNDSGDPELNRAPAQQPRLPRRAALISVGAGLAGTFAG